MLIYRRFLQKKSTLAAVCVLFLYLILIGFVRSTSAVPEIMELKATLTGSLLLILTVNGHTFVFLVIFLILLNNYLKMFEQHSLMLQFTSRSAWLGYQLKGILRLTWQYITFIFLLLFAVVRFVFASQLSWKNFMAFLIVYSLFFLAYLLFALVFLLATLFTGNWQAFSVILVINIYDLLHSTRGFILVQKFFLAKYIVQRDILYSWLSALVLLSSLVIIYCLIRFKIRNMDFLSPEMNQDKKFLGTIAIMKEQIQQKKHSLILWLLIALALIVFFIVSARERGIHLLENTLRIYLSPTLNRIVLNPLEWILSLIPLFLLLWYIGIGVSRELADSSLHRVIRYRSRVAFFNYLFKKVLIWTLLFKVLQWVILIALYGILIKADYFRLTVWYSGIVSFALSTLTLLNYQIIYLFLIIKKGVSKSFTIIILTMLATVMAIFWFFQDGQSGFSPVLLIPQANDGMSWIEINRVNTIANLTKFAFPGWYLNLSYLSLINGLLYIFFRKKIAKIDLLNYAEDEA